MIHQIIFANAKPGMTISDFQDYWINVHAEKYARKIQQILKYKVNRLSYISENERPTYHGMAEIWLFNEQTQLASLQSDEYIHGARENEPEWAAFWQSICLDTYSQNYLTCDTLPAVKCVIVCKRKGGIPLKVFRSQIESNVQNYMNLTEIRQAQLCLVKDTAYSFGETVCDAVIQLWFEERSPLLKAVEGLKFRLAMDKLYRICKQKYLHRFIAEENIII
ncbi:MAG: EthD domain-containing protein [Clostridiales bacterium]|nr:EthD domain-containing protein [Clostridiales bacterium]